MQAQRKIKISTAASGRGRVGLVGVDWASRLFLPRSYHVGMFAPQPLQNAQVPVPLGCSGLQVGADF